MKTKDDRAPSAGPEIGWLKVPAALLTLLLVVVLLTIGQPVLLPILLAVIAVYILVETEAALARLPGLGRLPRIVLRGLVLILFLALLSAFVDRMMESMSRLDILMRPRSRRSRRSPAIL